MNNKLRRETAVHICKGNKNEKNHNGNPFKTQIHAKPLLATYDMYQEFERVQQDL